MTEILRADEINLGNLPEISEDVFLSLLPEFVENVGKPADQQKGEAKQKLFDMVKSELTRVNVVDQEGNVLFWMPQMSYVPDLSGYNINAFLSEYDAVQRRSPAKANKEFDNFFKSTLTDIKIPKEDVEQWRMILKRYGYVKDKDAKGRTEEPGQNKDRLEFDEDW